MGGVGELLPEAISNSDPVRSCVRSAFPIEANQRYKVKVAERTCMYALKETITHKHLHVNWHYIYMYKVTHHLEQVHVHALYMYVDM